MRDDDQLLDRNWLKALGHPLRLRLLEAVTDAAEASPVQLARMLDQPLGTVSRHMRLLRDLGFIELARGEPRRGAVEHFYRAVRAPFIDDRDWERLPVPMRRGLARQTLRKVFAEAAIAGGDGGFDGAGAGIARIPLRLDAEGQRELTEVVMDLLRRAKAIQERSDGRAAPADGARTTCLAVLHFAHGDRPAAS